MTDENKSREELMKELKEFQHRIDELEISASKSKVSKNVAEGRLKFVRTLSDISSKFVGVRDIDSAINLSLSDMGRMANASRAYLFLIWKDGTRMDNTHEWCAKGVSPQIGNLQNLPIEVAPWWMSRLRQGAVIHIRDVSRMPDEAKAEREILERQDIKSLLVFPLRINRELAGFIGFDDVWATGGWNDDDFAILRIGAEIIGSALEHKWTDDKLEERERLYRLIADNVTDIIWTMDLDLHYTYISPSVTRMRGYTVKEAMVQTLEEILTPESVEIAKKAFAEEMAVERKEQKDLDRIRTIEVEIYRKDGSTFFAEIRMTFLRTPDGRPMQILGCTRDITERRRAEEIRSRLAAIVESSDDAIIGKDLDGTIITWNQGAERIYGYKAEEIMGRRISILIPDQYADDYNRIIERIKQGEDVDHFETVRLRKDGKEIPVSLTVSPTKSRSGKIIGISAISRDITKQKQTEEKLRRLATTDGLTGVLNRGSGLLLFGKQLKIAKRDGSRLTICYVDLDQLKKINDTYGHLEGDEALKTVSRFLKEALREVDTVCRMGGDEFLLILPQCTIEQADSVWKRVAGLMEAFIKSKSKPYVISLSHGFAEFDPAEERTIDQLIAAADQEMYRDKQNRRTGPVE